VPKKDGQSIILPTARDKLAAFEIWKVRGLHYPPIDGRIGFYEDNQKLMEDLELINARENHLGNPPRFLLFFQKPLPIAVFLRKRLSRRSYEAGTN